MYVYYREQLCKLCYIIKYKFYILLYVKITLIIINSRERNYILSKKKKKEEILIGKHVSACYIRTKWKLKKYDK